MAGGRADSDGAFRARSQKNLGLQVLGLFDLRRGRLSGAAREATLALGDA
jgi:hypothetical protein